MASKGLNMETAIKRYNEIVESECYEHLIVGDPWNFYTTDWNLRDMVAEIDYIRSTYYEVGHCNEELRYSDKEEERKFWRRQVGRMTRFINRYAPFTKDMVCAEGHCSDYD